MHYQTEQEITSLVAQFSNKTLKKEDWTHAAHLTVALWHLKNYSLDEATCIIKSKIISYNIAVGTANNGSSGYHETMTIFWMTVLCFFVERHQNKNLLDTCNDFFQTPLASNTLPFYFYNKFTILSPAARARFTPADKHLLYDEAMRKILDNEVVITMI